MPVGTAHQRWTFNLGVAIDKICIYSELLACFRVGGSHRNLDNCRKLGAFNDLCFCSCRQRGIAALKGNGSTLTNFCLAIGKARIPTCEEKVVFGTAGCICVWVWVADANEGCGAIWRRTHAQHHESSVAARRNPADGRLVVLTAKRFVAAVAAIVMAIVQPGFWDAFAIFLFAAKNIS